MWTIQRICDNFCLFLATPVRNVLPESGICPSTNSSRNWMRYNGNWPAVLRSMGKKDTSKVGEVRLIPIALADEIVPGASISDKILESLRGLRLRLHAGDILVV